MTSYVDVDNVLVKLDKAYDDLRAGIEGMRMIRTAYGYDIEELGQFARYLQELGIQREDVKKFINDSQLLYEAMLKNWDERVQKVYDEIRINTLLSSHLIRPEASIEMMFPIGDDEDRER